MTCSVENCEAPARTRGYCTKHYQRVRKYGDPHAGKRNHAPLEERVWRHIDKRGPNDCWEWTARRVRGGYGCIQTGGKGSSWRIAHRIIYELEHGEIPDGHVVMHRCDNPPCCNPRHLKAATQLENMRDMIAKKRRVLNWPVGEENGKSKLTEEKVRYIRDNAERGWRALSVELGLDYTTVRSAGVGKSWKHVT